MREMIKVAMLKALLMVLAKIAVSAPIIIYLRFFKFLDPTFGGFLALGCFDFFGT